MSVDPYKVAGISEINILGDVGPWDSCTWKLRLIGENDGSGGIEEGIGGETSAVMIRIDPWGGSTSIAVGLMELGELLGLRWPFCRLLLEGLVDLCSTNVKPSTSE